MPDARISSVTAASVIASAIVNRLAFRKALSALLPVVERRNAIPVLVCVRLGIEGNRITLGATDLDIHLSTVILTDVGSGSCAVAMEHPHSLASFLGKMSAKSVGVQIADDQNGKRSVIVSAGSIRAEFPTQNVDDFPVPRAQPSDAMTFHFGGAQLVEAIERVAFAISTEETRYYLNGIYLHAAKSGDVPVLRAVATDGHRLALTDIASDLTLPANDEVPKSWGEIIPRKAVSLLASFARQGAVEVAFSSVHMWVKSGDSAMYSKLIDGTFPDYNRVIPTGNDNSAVLPSDLIRLAVGRVSLGATERTKACKITIRRDDVVLQSRSCEGLSITETVALPEAPSMALSPEFEHGLNAKYLMQCLRHFPGAVKYRWADAGSPMLFHAADVHQSQATHLVILMPMRV